MPTPAGVPVAMTVPAWRVMQVPGGDVVDDGVAKNIVIGVFFPDVFRIFPQDDGQLRLIVQAIHEVKMPRDGVAGAGAVGGPFGEIDGAPLFPGKGVGVELLSLGVSRETRVRFSSATV